jgi:tetratricopeptide (TPR) repeat protein
MEPTLLEAHSNRGEAYAWLGEYEKAIADFDQELAINPNDANACASRILAAKVSSNNK